MYIFLFDNKIFDAFDGLGKKIITSLSIKGKGKEKGEKGKEKEGKRKKGKEKEGKREGKRKRGKRKEIGKKKEKDVLAHTGK